MLWQVVGTTCPAFECSTQLQKSIFWFLIAGLPITLAIAWVNWKTAILVGSGLLAGATVMFFVMRGPATETRTTVIAPPVAVTQSAPEPDSAIEEKSIAVLPFVNMSADPEQEYFSDGISEEILHALVGVPDLRVVARTSAFSFKGKEIDIRTIGDTLSVNHVLEGSVRKAGNRLRITAQLIKVDDGFHLWSETYDREMTDIFAIQEEIARSVVEKLEVALGLAAEDPLVQIGTADTEAYTWYLEGRYEFKQQSPQSVRKAIESFTKAIELDPDFAGGYGGLALVSADMSLSQPYGVFADQVRAAYKRALELDGSQVEALLAKAWDTLFTDYDFRTSEALVKKALEVSADKTLVVDNYIFLYLVPQRRFDEALQLLALAEREDPLSPLLKRDVGYVLLYKGDHDEEALSKFNEAFELNPEDGYLMSGLRMVYTRLGRLAEAEEALDQIETAIGREHPFWLVADARLRLALGERDAAEADRQEMIAVYESGQFSPATFIGNISASLGLLDEAIIWFERADETREFWSINIAMYNRHNSALWDHPRFQALLKKMNLDDASIAAAKMVD